jgi:hypothetical protein
MLKCLRRQRAMLAVVGCVLVYGLLDHTLAAEHSHADAASHSELVAVAHDAHAHRIGATTQSAAHVHEHCYICHWVRSFRPAKQSHRVGADRLSAGRLDLGFSALPNHPVVSQLPARSPPA